MRILEEAAFMAQTSLQPIDSSNISNPSDAKRVNVVFSPEQYSTLQNLAQMQNISISEALRQAINVSSLIVNANADADTQILLKKGSNVQELKIIR
jgi:hypothetical protein